MQVTEHLEAAAAERAALQERLEQEATFYKVCVCMGTCLYLHRSGFYLNILPRLRTYPLIICFSVQHTQALEGRLAALESQHQPKGDVQKQAAVPTPVAGEALTSNKHPFLISHLRSACIIINLTPDMIHS